MRRFAVVTTIALTAVCVACASGSSDATTTRTTPPAQSPVPTVTFGRTMLRVTGANARALEVETAVTSEQSERGLGYRDTLATDAGMLFDLHATRVPTFWMKGMRFPLDMVWIDGDQRVAEVTTAIQAQPGASDAELRRYSPSVPVRYVLELNSSEAARLGVTPGAQLSFSLP